MERNVQIELLNWLTSDGAADDGLWVLPLVGLRLPSQNALILDGRDETGMESHRGQRVKNLSIIRITQRKIEYLFRCKRSIPERRPSSSGPTSSRTTLFLLRYAVHAKGLKSSHTRLRISDNFIGVDWVRLQFGNGMASLDGRLLDQHYVLVAVDRRIVILVQH
ncbi:hypothetical protein WR25_02536 [Diploscapter pachys]|uniref:Uncharacterized protein n=1 Tax=Diploscapter pachys TaxID=2018661 RepID=A0A2A2KUE2_9BILA|nr:hypothetical protein WR25_02536 [Diploscapter pachys]